jgi:ribonucleoside-diphosphate reductase alpha chain
MLSDLESRGLVIQKRPDSDDIPGAEHVAKSMAKKIVARFTEKQRGSSPPFPPARYGLPDERTSITHKATIYSKDVEHEYYFNLGYYPDGKVGEIFVTKGGDSEERAGIMDALATVVSIGLQYGIPWEVFEAKLSRQRFEPSGFTDFQHESLRHVSSPLDYLARYVGARCTLAMVADALDSGDDDE